MSERALTLPAELTSDASAETRLRALVNAHFRSVWRFVRRLGVAEGDVDDVVQEVIMVAARRLNEIRTGSERAFLMATAFRVASDVRRSRQRRGETSDDELLIDVLPGPDALLEQRQLRELLDQLLDTLPIELRAVFVLYELDGLTMAEIAEALSLAPGTVASRLRRARELFETRVERLRTRFAKGAER